MRIILLISASNGFECVLVLKIQFNSVQYSFDTLADLLNMDMDDTIAAICFFLRVICGDKHIVNFIYMGFFKDNSSLVIRENCAGLDFVLRSKLRDLLA